MLKIVLSLILAISSGSLYAELLVIVHPNSEVNSLSQQQVSDLYLGRLLGKPPNSAPSRAAPTISGNDFTLSSPANNSPRSTRIGLGYNLQDNKNHLVA